MESITVNKNKNILITLDSILDFRFSLLYKIDKDLATKLIIDDVYDVRYINEFDYINRDTFEYLYSQGFIFKKAYATNMVEVIGTEALALYNKKNTMDLADDTVYLDINVHPYPINEKIEDTLNKVFSVFTMFNNVKVRLISIPMTEMNLDYIDENYDSVFVYDGLKFLDYHYIKGSGHAPTTNIYSAMVLPGVKKLDSIKELEEVFKIYKDVYKSKMNLVYLPLEVYSVMNRIQNKIREDKSI